MRIVIWHFFEETTEVKNFLRLRHLYLPRFLARNVTTKCRLPFKSSCMYKKGGYIMKMCTVQQYDSCTFQLKSIHFWNSVFHFMKTRSVSWCQLGLAGKGLVKGPCFYKMKIVQTLFWKRMDFIIVLFCFCPFFVNSLSFTLYIYYFFLYLL